ncbi:META domain-containing protein [Rhodobacteraceae bacterium CCMM004]|nr:META domain-containing protein [Rhodobacteraceae bacterium CCMM004]
MIGTRAAVLAAGVLAACTPDETISAYADPGAVYRLIEVDGAPAGMQATLSFPAPGAVRGTGPCNAFTAAQGVPYPWIDVGPIAATRRACPDLAAETAYFAALEAATLAEVQGGTLILSDATGPRLVFRRAAD